MIKKEISLQNDFFQYKEVDHLIQYMDGYGKFKSIIEDKCFKPSYCKERFNDETILIPMVSFCNIPLTQVDHFVYYGDYGIGLSRKWAIKNQISPVSYVHKKSPIYNMGSSINEMVLLTYTKMLFQKVLKNKLEERDINPEGIVKKTNSGFSEEDLVKLNQFAIKNIQFSKYWETEIDVKFEIKESKTKHKQKNIKINCYNEREWRFIPELSSEEYPKIISNKNNSQEPEFKKFSKSNNKPHISEKEYTLKFKLNDLKYLLVREGEIDKTIKLLKKKFGKKEVSDQLEKGELLILTRDKIFRDF